LTIHRRDGFQIQSPRCVIYQYSHLSQLHSRRLRRMEHQRTDEKQTGPSTINNRSELGHHSVSAIGSTRCVIRVEGTFDSAQRPSHPNDFNVFVSHVRSRRRRVQVLSPNPENIFRASTIDSHVMSICLQRLIIANSMWSHATV
jgi:hypothetical protein